MRKCRNCKSKRIIKNEEMFGLQRYECKECGYIFEKTFNVWKDAILTLILWALGVVAAICFSNIRDNIALTKGIYGPDGINYGFNTLLFSILIGSMFLIIGYIFGLKGKRRAAKYKEAMGQKPSGYNFLGIILWLPYVGITLTLICLRLLLEIR